MSDRIDLLNRESFVGDVIKIVNQASENKRGCCFAMDGGGGIGKTFVIEEVEQLLQEIQFEETKSDRYFVFHYNCWQYDYYEEPSVAIISAMIASIQKDNAMFSENFDSTIKTGCELAVEKLKEIAGIFIENRIGVNLISIAEDIKDKRDNDQKDIFAFDVMFNFSQTIERTRKNLQEIAEQRTIILIVDELDRCVPGYAIKVLERLHHIFYGLENVVVIMALDRKQLEHSVEEMFGARDANGSMDIEKYLKKFIDFSVVLDNGKVNDSLREKYEFYFRKFYDERTKDIEKMNSILTMLSSEIDIRMMEKIVEKANLVHSLICSEKVHISVLAFEIMFEIVTIWGIKMDQVLDICEDIYLPRDIDVRIGILRRIVENAYNNLANYVGKPGREIADNLYGDIYFYFWRLFNNQSNIGIIINYKRKDLEKDMEIAKKYYEFCKIIK